MKTQNVLEQSKTAYKQWAEQWREQAKFHRKHYPFKPLTDFRNIGVGKALVLVANGYSLEKNIDVLKKHMADVDIMCCDKSLGHLIRHGIKPKFCLVCDANVPYKYMEQWKDELYKTTLITNVCGNPEWTENGNWKAKYFFINMDVIQSEKEFMELSGCQNLIPAATNVSNAMLVMATQCSNQARNNAFGYDKIILLGYDYCWTSDGGYYAFDFEGSGKRNYMKHVFLRTRTGQFAYTSSNLLFSAQWLEQYIKNFKLPVVNCSEPSILGACKARPLEEQIGYKYKPLDCDRVKMLMSRRDRIGSEMLTIERELKEIGQDHWYNFVGTV
jgi:hypothetical protein